jgi:hypothetical protein
MELGLKNSALLKNILRRFHDPAQLRWILTGLVVAIAIVGVYLPLSGRADDMERKATHEKERLALIKDLEHLREDYKEIKKHLPTKWVPSDWAAYLSDGTRKHEGLTLIGLETQSTRSMPPFKLAVFMLVLDGTFPLFDDYLRWLDTNDKILRVDTVKIEPSDRGDTLSMKILVQCVME